MFAYVLYSNMYLYVNQYSNPPIIRHAFCQENKVLSEGSLNRGGHLHYKLVLVPQEKVFIEREVFIDGGLN